MFERKEKIINNKKFFISHDYIRKVFEPNYSHRNIKSNDNNSNFKKIETVHKIGITNEQPLVLFHKPNLNNIHSLENKIKKDLVENKGYLNDGGYKKKLLKYYSYHNTDQNQSKNIYRSLTQNKNRSKINDNDNIFSSKHSSFNMGLNSRTLQKEYSNSIKKFKPKIKQKKEKEKEVRNKIFNSVNLTDVKNKNLLIQKLLNKDYIEKNMFKVTNKNKTKENDYKRKKDYLKNNYISYEDETENEKEKNNDKSKIINSNNKNDKELKDIKNINNKNIFKSDNDYFNSNKNNKKRYKDIVNQFEFLKKIKKEYNILKKSKNKDKQNILTEKKLIL